MTLNDTVETIYFQSSTARNSDDLEVMYRDLGYDFRIKNLIHAGKTEIDFQATVLDTIRVVRSSFSPTKYTLEKADTDQGYQIFHEGTGVSIINGAEIPLSKDHASFHNGRERMERHEETPGDTTYIMWDEKDLLKFVSDQLGRTVTTPVSFGHDLDLTNNPMGPVLKNFLKFLENDLIPVTDELNMPIVSKNIADTFYAMILTAQDSNYHETLLTPQSPAIPAYVKQARDYLNENSHLPISMSDLTALCNVSGSALHAGFRRYMDISPMSYLKNIRLDRVRDDLKAAEPCVGVGAIARNWGFTHLGRFATDYANRFNEKPMQTLRKS